MTPELMLSWNCEHEFENVGTPYVTWVSNKIDSKPPDDAPKTQKVRCKKCHGVDWIHIGAKQ